MTEVFIAFFEFLSDAHIFIQWSALWLLWGVFAVINIPFRIINRICRSINIRNAGWPENPLMDADGDICHPDKEKDE